MKSDKTIPSKLSRYPTIRSKSQTEKDANVPYSVVLVRAFHSKIYDRFQKKIENIDLICRNLIATG